MNYEGFLNAIRELNENSYFYGNEILYKLAEESDLHDERHLAGMMWLIGRSYAASPQRRSYAKKWPVRQDNDGRDQFFSYISHALELPVLLDKHEGLSYCDLNEDMKLLTASVNMVLQFNLALSAAIEQFDGVSGNIHCTNHISFCSKFLHFYHQHAVFIIDTYAQNGAAWLFGGYHQKKRTYICVTDADNMDDRQNTYCFDKSVYEPFSRKKVTELTNLMGQELADLLKQYQGRKPENAKAYMEHCVRAYLLGCELKRSDIIPSAQLAGEAFRSMPRLIDTVFLNIKRGDKGF